jgi:hypothetical protein
MHMPSISSFAIGGAAIAPLAIFLRHLLKQPIKVSSTSDELLDLFEDRCALLEEHVASTSPHDETFESLTTAASNDLAPVNASPIRLKHDGSK